MIRRLALTKWLCRLLKQRTSIGYTRFRCKICRCIFNERSGTVFNFLEYPTDLVLMVVRWRLRDCFSLRNLSEMMLERGVEFSHETVRLWEEKCAPLITEHLRKRRKACQRLIDVQVLKREAYILECRGYQSKSMHCAYHGP